MTHAAQYVCAHGALVLFTWILVRQAGLPVPDATLLLSIGALASSGRADFAASLAAASGGCVVADGFWYRVGRLGSSKYHHVPPMTGNWKGRVLAFITRHAAGALLPAKFISASNLASLLAGQAGVPAVQFLVFDSIVSLAWAASYVAVGYFLRTQVQWTVAHALRPSLVLLSATAVWPLAVLLKRKSKWSLRIDLFISFRAATWMRICQHWLLAATSGLMFVLSFLLAENEPEAGGEVQNALR